MQRAANDKPPRGGGGLRLLRPCAGNAGQRSHPKDQSSCLQVADSL
jgi:hypothetical protein